MKNVITPPPPTPHIHPREQYIFLNALYDSKLSSNHCIQNIVRTSYLVPPIEVDVGSTLRCLLEKASK